MSGSRLGLPDLQGRRGVAAAAAVDSLGTGLFLPFSVLYFLTTTSLPATTIGLALSAGAVLALPTSPLVGPVVDRVGPRAVTLAANLAQAAGFGGYLVVSSWWQLVGCCVLVSAGQNAFWTANGALVTLVADPGERTRWFGMLRALRNAGYGAGGLLASVAVTLGGATGYRAIVLVNAVSFVGAALLTATWRPRAARPSGPRTAPGYRVLFADHGFRLAMAANVVFVLCTLVLTVVLAVYVTVGLGLPGWLPGALFTLATVLVLAGQLPAARYLERGRRTSTLRCAAVLWAGAFVLLWCLSVVPPALALAGAFLAVVVHTAAEIVYSPVMSDLVATLAADVGGRSFAVQQLTWGVARAVAPAAFLFLFARGAPWLWGTLTACCVVAVLVLARLRAVLGDRDVPVRRSG